MRAPSLRPPLVRSLSFLKSDSVFVYRLDDRNDFVRAIRIEHYRGRSKAVSRIEESANPKVPDGETMGARINGDLHQAKHWQDVGTLFVLVTSVCVRVFLVLVAFSLEKRGIA